MQKFLFLMICLFLVACQPEYQVPPDKVRIHIGAEPATLNLMTASDAYASQVNYYIFDNLIERDKETLEIKPKLATHWTISPDKKTYTFYLRKDVTWHDGKPFTADDVIYSFNLLKDPELKAPHLKVYYQDLDKVTKIDDYTVQFHYNKIYFLALSVCGTLPIVPKHIVEQYKDFDASPISRNPIGNGPYKFKEWVTNTRIVLERNENYWGPKPQIKTIEFRIIADAAIGLQIVKKGELDVYSLSSIQWARQTSSEKFNQMFYKFAYASPGYSYIGWNNNHKIFSDPLVRRAMTHMVDRKKINEKLDFNLGSIVTGPFFPFSKQYNKNIKPLEFDVDKAKELLRKAGWIDSNGDGLLDKDGQDFKFTFLYPSAAKTTERIATILKEELKKIGIEMNITKLEWAAFLDKINKREFDATMLGWSSPYESDPYQVWDISQVKVQGSSNFISFENQEASDLIRQARIEFDETKRNQLYWHFQEILHDLQPYTFMFNRPSIEIVSTRFKNVKLHKTGTDLLEWKIE